MSGSARIRVKRGSEEENTAELHVTAEIKSCLDTREQDNHHHHDFNVLDRIISSILPACIVKAVR